MAGGFLYDNLIVQGVGIGAIGSLDAAGTSNLLDPQPRIRARWLGTAATVLVDFGALRSVDCVAVISTTLGAFGSLGTVRVRLSTVDATGVAGNAWDTGTVSAATGAESAGNIIMVRAAGPVSARYLLSDVVDGAAPYVDIGLVAAGALWRLPASAAIGQVVGREILDRFDRNEMTGAEFPVAAFVNPRVEAFQIDWFTDADEAGTHRAMLTKAGGTVTGLYIPELTLSQADLNVRSLWGRLAQPGQDCGLQQYNVGIWRRSWRIVERV